MVSFWRAGRELLDDDRVCNSEKGMRGPPKYSKIQYVKATNWPAAIVLLAVGMWLVQFVLKPSRCSFVALMHATCR